jgi:methylmalonyl-CoA mutase
VTSQPNAFVNSFLRSVTLYGNDPHVRPDIYGRNAGVCCLDDVYSGFDLVHAMTSVSMTINGPAPMLLFS